MKRQHVVAAGLGALVLAAIGAALLMVFSEPAMEPPLEPEVAAQSEPRQEDVATGGEKRRHAGHEGNSSLRGRLVRGKKGVPVVGGTVRLDREGTKGWSALTGDDGTFRIDRLPHGGPFTISADVAECAPVQLPGIAIERRQELDVGDIRVDRAVSVTIVVRGLDDTPIEGALVEAFAQTTFDWTMDWTKRLAQVGIAPTPVMSLRTDAKGEARFASIASGSWAFRASATGHARRGHGGRSLSPDDDEGRDAIVIRLPPGNTLSGVVMDQDDAPIPGAQVLAMKPNHAWSPQMSPLHHRATTDEEGRYVIDEMPAGEFAIWAARPEGVPAQVAVLRVPDLSSFDVHLRLGGKLHGRVTEAESGEPVPDVEVRAQGWAQNSQRVGLAVTDAEGRYVIDTMLEGMVQQVTVDRPGWVVVQKTATPWQQIALNYGAVVEHNVELRRGAIVKGVVTGPDGPVGEASVSLYLTSAGGGWQTHTGKSDASGTYRIEGLPEGKGMLNVQAKGLTQRGFPANYWEAMNNNSVPDEFAVDVGKEGEFERDAVLVRGGQASGTVTDSNGEPLEGVTVSAWTNGSSVQAETDAEGAFELVGLPLDGQLTLNAAAKGFVAASQPLTASDGAPLTGIEFKLETRATVRGTITTHDGSAPTHAVVQLTQQRAFDSSNPYNWQDPERLWDAIEATPVRANGTYEIDLPIATGKFIVRATADGYSPTESEPTDAVAGQETYDIDIEIGEGMTLTGRVIDETTSDPVAGAYVALGTLHPQAQTQPWVAQNVFPPLRGMTDADGRFSLTCTREGKFDVRVTHDGYVEAKLMPAIPHTGDLDVKLKAALEIRGVVRTTDGTPVSGVQISYASSQPQTFNQQQTIVSGEDGSFVIRDLGKGKYNVTAQPAWGGKVNVRPKTIEGVDAGRSDLEIMVEPGLAISGRVLGPDGEPITNTWINAQKENPTDTNNVWRGANTGVDGTFEIVGLEEGTYTLHVNAPGQGAQSTQMKGVAAGSQDIVVRLAAGMEISGVLVDERGDPVAGIQLYATAVKNDGGGMTYGNQMVQTAGDGTFKLTGLAPGEYAIQKSGGGSAEQRNHVLDGGGNVAAGSSGVRLVLTAGAAISGVVVDASGAPVANVKSMWVKAQIGSNQDMKWANVGADGKFRIEGLADDIEYGLRTMGGGFRPGSAGPVLGGTADVRIVVEPGLTCSGRLVDSHGDGISGANITFRVADSQDYTWAQTGADGSFTAAGMEDVEYTAAAYIQSKDSDGNRTGQQRQVELGTVSAGSTRLLLEVPEE